MRLFLQFILMTLLCSAQSINEQLKELEHAPPKQRVELMNHIKEQLILMNQEQRVDTINKLRAKLQPQAQTQIKTHQRIPRQMRDRIINLQQTNIAHQESKQHIIDIRNHHIKNNIPINHQQPSVNQPNIPTNQQEQPVVNQPNIPTNQQEQPVVNQPNIQTNHQEQPVINQPNIQTNQQEQPVINQPNIETIQQGELITNPSNSQSGRGQ